MTQEELLPLLRQKDEKAFQLLYDNYAKSLYSVVCQFIKDQHEAEDVLQEVFVKIWSQMHRYEPTKGRLYTWMLNIARNTAIDKLRSKGHNNAQKNVDADNFTHLMADNRSWMLSVESIGIKEFVKKLKPKCIQLIELLFYRGYTQQEASEALEWPLGTVKTQNRMCINDLRNYLGVK